jgi:hypothetical protein
VRCIALALTLPFAFSQYPQLYQSVDDERLVEVHDCINSNSGRAVVTPDTVRVATLSFESDRTMVQFLVLQAKLIEYAYEL